MVILQVKIGGTQETTSLKRTHNSGSPCPISIGWRPLGLEQKHLHHLYSFYGQVLPWHQRAHVRMKKSMIGWIKWIPFSVTWAKWFKLLQAGCSNVSMRFFLDEFVCRQFYRLVEVFGVHKCFDRQLLLFLSFDHVKCVLSACTFFYLESWPTMIWGHGKGYMEGQKFHKRLPNSPIDP